MQKVPIASFLASDEVNKYLQLVTPYAFPYVLKQIINATKVTLGQENNGSFHISHQEWCTVTATTLQYSCFFLQSDAVAMQAHFCCA